MIFEFVDSFTSDSCSVECFSNIIGVVMLIVVVDEGLYFNVEVVRLTLNIVVSGALNVKVDVKVLNVVVLDVKAAVIAVVSILAVDDAVVIVDIVVDVDVVIIVAVDVVVNIDVVILVEDDDVVLFVILLVDLVASSVVDDVVLLIETCFLMDAVVVVFSCFDMSWMSCTIFIDSCSGCKIIRKGSFNFPGKLYLSLSRIFWYY